MLALGREGHPALHRPARRTGAARGRAFDRTVITGDGHVIRDVHDDDFADRFSLLRDDMPLKGDGPVLPPVVRADVAVGADPGVLERLGDLVRTGPRAVDSA